MNVLKVMADRKLSANEELWRLNVKRIYAEKKKELGLNQDKLAEVCGWKSQGTVSQYFTGGRALSTDAKLKLARALKVPVTEIDPDMIVFKQSECPETPSEFMERNAHNINQMSPSDLLKLAGLIEGYVKAKTENKE